MSVPEQQVTVGFVGLGNMGWPMAGNLHAAGFRLVVRDIEAAKQDRFAAEHPGAVAASSPDEFAPAGLVVTMLPNGAIVRDAMLGWRIGPALRDGALLVEMSSSDPSDTLLLAAGLQPFGVRMVDAPVSGGVPRAVTGELAVMVGGASADVAAAQQVLRVLGDPARQFRTGRLGSGHAMKALNNVIAAATTCVTAEALVVGQRFGLDPRTMIDIVNASTGRSFVSGVFDSEVLTGRYGTGFALGLLAKDVHIAASVAAAAGADVPVIALTDERYAKALTELGPAADQSMAHQAWWDEPLARLSARDRLTGRDPQAHSVDRADQARVPAVVFAQPAGAQHIAVRGVVHDSSFSACPGWIRRPTWRAGAGARWWRRARRR